jgi:hypothetical protein
MAAVAVDDVDDKVGSGGSALPTVVGVLGMTRWGVVVVHFQQWLEY